VEWRAKALNPAFGDGAARDREQAAPPSPVHQHASREKLMPVSYRHSTDASQRCSARARTGASGAGGPVRLMAMRLVASVGGVGAYYTRPSVSV
jgi:hypothetical protein